jgi:hypothetical protein
VADLRLQKAADAAAQAFGFKLRQPSVHRHQHPDLYAAEMTENVAEFVELITAGQRAVTTSEAPLHRRTA